jgi:hypothetical protein
MRYKRLVNLLVSSIFLAGLSIATGLLKPSPVYAEYESGPITTNGCYPIGDERIKFVAQLVYTNNDNQLHRIASNISGCNGTHIWDDKWYYWVLPDNQPKFLLVSWKNLTKGNFGYTLIHNTPTTWWYKTNDSGYKSIANGQQKKLTWWVNGHRVDIDIKNPYNRNGWNANHIWYSFGY